MEEKIQITFGLEVVWAKSLVLWSAQILKRWYPHPRRCLPPLKTLPTFWPQVWPSKGRGLFLYRVVRPFFSYRSVSSLLEIDLAVKLGKRNWVKSSVLIGSIPNTNKNLQKTPKVIGTNRNFSRKIREIIMVFTTETWKVSRDFWDSRFVYILQHNWAQTWKMR